MKKINYLVLLLLSFVLVGCNKSKEEPQQTQASKENNAGMVVTDKKEKRSTIVNNMVVGHSKISFNNEEYDEMSQGKFTQETLWGTFQKEGDRDTYIQIDAFDNTQSMYGDLSGYVLEGIDWDLEQPVEYLSVMEEAIQESKDKKVLMYKGRTGDIIFSVTMFGKKKLTNQEILDLKKIAKSIKIEYVGDQMMSSSDE